MQIAFAQSNLAGRAKTWALGLKLHDPYVFGSLEGFKSLLRQKFSFSEPPRAGFRARSELLRIKRGKRDVHSYIQYIRLLTSCITVDPLNQQTLITLFMQDLTDSPVKIYVFRLEFNILEETIRVAEQEDFSMKQAHTNSNSYRPSRRQENGGPAPMDLCNARSESSLINNYKKLQKYNRFQKTGHYVYECRAPSAVPRTVGNSNRQAAKRGPRRRSDVVVKTQQRNGQPKNGQGQ